YVPADTNHLGPDEHTEWLTVAGVVREVRFEDLAHTKTFGAIYLPAAQHVQRGLSLVVKATGDSAAAVQSLRTTAKELDPEMLLNFVQPMDEYVASSLMPRRATMLLATSFGIVSLLLAAVGIYGVLAFLVTQRFREIGIRIALGGTPGRIFTLILREGLVLLAVGLMLGLLGTSMLEEVLKNEVYGLSVMDPVVIGGVALMFGVIAMLACSIPARRATQVDAVTVLTLR